MNTEQELIDKIKAQKKNPKHIAIIMDGNGRWAKKRNAPRLYGHQQGAKAVRRTIEAAVSVGIKEITLYTFSQENWQRPENEIKGLMKLLNQTLEKELPTLMKNNISLHAIGNLNQLPSISKKKLLSIIQQTEKNTRCKLTLALSYGSQQELTTVVQTLAQKVKQGEINPENINSDMVEKHLDTAFLSTVELLIRTGGERRLSNFLLWQLAYSELYFMDKLWPDFQKIDFYHVILHYQKLERRFGRITEQINQI